MMIVPHFVSAWRLPLVLGTLLGSLQAGSAWAGGVSTVTNLNDSGAGSLRAAITSANGGSNSVIMFQPGLSGTIALASAEPNVTTNLTIQGPSLTSIVLNGGQKYRVFSLSSSASLTISNLTIQYGSDALDSSGGGGILNSGGALSLSGCTIASNAATQGGGVYSVGGVTTFVNCTLLFNTATVNGGGFRNNGGSATLTGCTISSNTGATGGGLSSDVGTMILLDDILAGDTGGELAGSAAPISAGTISADYCDIIPSVPSGTFTDGGHNISVNPKFGSYQDNGGPTLTVNLLPGSPCFGAGIADVVLATDQRGIARPISGGIEIGSYQSVAPSVQSGHILWTNTNGQAAVWNLADAVPVATAMLYGPYTGWTAQAIAQGPDGTGRILWTNTDGRAALWNLADAVSSSTAAIYGPFPGWTATALTVGPDNAAHLLWDNTDGRVALWNTTDAIPSNTAAIYGPFGGWSGTAIGIGADNHERLLWDNRSGQIAVWNLSDAVPVNTAALYGPYTGWTAKRLSVGPDNAAHLLWDNISGQIAAWNLNDPNPTATASLFGSYIGWAGQDLSVGSDANPYLLWDNINGMASLWTLADANPASTYQLYGPYTNWAAVSASGVSQVPDTTVINGLAFPLSATPSGLKYYDTLVGTGAGISNGQYVTVQYTGRLLDGTKFDSSYNPGRTAFTFMIGAGHVIMGFDEGVLSMKVGGQRRLVIPGRLAYGANPTTTAIPANATLVFDIEVVSVH